MSTSDDVRAAMGRLTAGERQTLAVRWTENAERWQAAGSALGPMWFALAALVLEVDRLEQARAAGGGDPHVMRHARPARK